MEHKSAIEIHGPSQHVFEREGKLYEDRSDPFIKFNVNFRKEWLAKLKGAKLSVFICLALHIDEDNKSYPSIDTIMAETELSNRAIINVIKELEGMKIIKVIRERGKVNRYKLAPIVAYGNKPVHVGPVNLVHTISSDTSELDDNRTCELLSPQSSHEVEPEEEPVKEEPLKDMSLKKHSDNGRITHQNKIRKELAEYFSTKTGLEVPVPTNEKQRREAGSLWYSPIREICELSGWDSYKGKTLIDHSIGRLDGLTVCSPKSIVKTAKAIVAEAKIGKGELRPKEYHEMTNEEFRRAIRSG